VKVENLAVSGRACERVGLHPGRWRFASEWNIRETDVDGQPTLAVARERVLEEQTFADRARRLLDLVRVQLAGLAAVT
jgi:hypothetical protein